MTIEQLLTAWRNDVVSTPVPPMPELDNYLQEGQK